MVCIVAFIAVMSLLSILALVMKLITDVFPASRPVKDPAVVSAIEMAVAKMVPGATISDLKKK